MLLNLELEWVDLVVSKCVGLQQFVDISRWFMLLAFGVFLNFLCIAIIYFKPFSDDVRFHILVVIFFVIGVIVNFGFIRNLIKIIKGKKNEE